MTYKSFEDFYHDAEIKHLVLFKHNNYLISPPFCTDKCKDYSRVLIYGVGGGVVWFDVDTPPATSKYNSMISIGDSAFFAPYGIWDKFNTVLELNTSGAGKATYHTLDSTGKGQFYNMSTDGVTAFAAPLGYEPVSFCLFIKDGTVKQIPVPEDLALKRHMGSVFSNGNYYSPPRGETLDYNSILKFNPDTEQLTMIAVNELPNSKRKYSDFIAVGDKLFALPFGREQYLQHMLVLDTTDDSVELVELNVPKFMKKYNAGVAIDDVIIAMPYGHKDDGDANYGLVFNTSTYEHTTFDIGVSFGGKYRFRSGVEFNGCAVFLPTGTPGAPIIAVDKTGKILYNQSFPEYILGRPIVHDGVVHTIAYHIESKAHYMFRLFDNFDTTYERIF
jgi:hypothetical protein